jgi:ABC-type amino acid transport substrate-binding protein
MGSDRGAERARFDRRQVLAAGAAVLAAWLGGCRVPGDAGDPPPTPTTPRTAGLWRVGCDFTNPPFASIGDDGRPSGRDVEMTQLVAAHLGLSLEWVRLPFEELLPALEEGRIDAVVATLGITPERAERVLFSRPYFETTIAVVVRRGVGEPRALADLAHGTVTAGAGTTAERAVLQRLGDEVLFAGAKDGASAAELLVSNRTDGVALDEPNAVALVRSRPEELRLLPEALARERYAIAVGKRSWRTLARIDEALRALTEAGELARLDAAWGVAEAVRR